MRYQAALRPDRARGFLWNVWQHSASRNLLLAAYMAVHLQMQAQHCRRLTLHQCTVRDSRPRLHIACILG